MEKKETIEQKKENKKKTINIALVVFSISIVVFTVIGALVFDNFAHIQQLDDLANLDEDTYKGQIDDKLRFIAMQDNDKFAAEEQKNDEESNNNLNAEEPQSIEEFFGAEPEKKNKFTEYNEKYGKKVEKEEQQEPLNPEFTDVEEEQVRPTYNTEFKPKMMKVLIGNYPTKEAAQSDLPRISSQFSSTPFIRTVAGSYALQVGTFKTQSTAYEFASSLRQQGYSVRIVEE